MEANYKKSSTFNSFVINGKSPTPKDSKNGIF